MKIKWTISILLLVFFISCKKEKCVDYKGYPPEVGKIILTKCAITGCHDRVSKDATAGLSLETWQDLFEGSRYGNTAVIPYRSDFSFLTYFINSYSDLGPIVPPLMPVGAAPLDRVEVQLVQNWINNGAKANNGLEYWSGFHGAKMYVINQGCDNVFMMDAATGKIMRCMNVGATPAIESPHYIEISPDEKYFYVCFYLGTVFQKFDAKDGKLIGTANIGAGLWSAFEISPDGKTAFVTDWSGNGTIAVVDLDSMTLLLQYGGPGLFSYPHGIGLKDNYLFVTEQPGNILHKIDITDLYNPNFSQITLQSGADVHEIHFSEDGTEYALSCYGLDEVWFFNSSTDAVIAKVPTGKRPEEPHYAGDYLFVSCPSDNVTFPGKTGCVTIINGKTHQFVKNIYTGWEPHGIVPDEEGNKVWILHRNVASGGPPPHHSSECNGKNGYMTAIDLNTLELISNLKPELSVDPYFGAITGHHH